MKAKAAKKKRPAKAAKPAEDQQPAERRPPIKCPACSGDGYRGNGICVRCEGKGTIVPLRTSAEQLKAAGGKAGRPPKYTPYDIEQIAEGIALGMNMEQAAALIPVHAETLRLWIKSDDEFFGAIKKAVAERQRTRLQYIESAGESWQSAAWLLERCHGTQYAPPKTIVHNEHSFQPGVDDDGMKSIEEMLNLL